MKFSKDFLQQLAWEDHDDNVEIISTELVDTTRWSLVYYQIFKIDGKFYETSYRTGATESQDERPYEYEDDEIECPEVVPVEKTITVYETKK